MIKYVPEMTSVVLEEIPDRVTLAVDISNCRGNCVGCHSPFLKEDVGEELTPEVISRLVSENYGIDCFLFLGEGRDPERLLELAAHVRALGLVPALYSGRREVDGPYWETFDYVKVGPYIPENGPLNNPLTNQRLYRVLGADEMPPEGAEMRMRASGRRFADITSRFWHRGLESQHT
ncbi:MAG: anaerobic ribonucleoside-triphosphate reductase activating protein [Bacteroidales bacterium]|nr:anaerobic ribonucleoside-triphosphate reductase activating protein [Bacteroidales bacterium]MBR5072537.1 anaerobic ribonucleoside-triphosphate reductase activating protein [Bacteroidales bacterium]